MWSLRTTDHCEHATHEVGIIGHNPQSSSPIDFLRDRSSGPYAMGETYYDVLGVAPEATRDEIEAAYRERVLETHPDHSDDPDAAEQFQRVRTAKSVLTDGTERARYDRLGHESYIGLAQSGEARDSDGSSRENAKSARSDSESRQTTTQQTSTGGETTTNGTSTSSTENAGSSGSNSGSSDR